MQKQSQSKFIYQLIILFIIANKNQEVYENIINLLFFIFQNINKKVRTALIIADSQRTEKITFTNIVCVKHTILWKTLFSIFTRKLTIN